MFASTIASSASSTAISSELGLAFAANVVAGCASAVGDDVRNSRLALARGALVDAPTPHRSSALGGACTVAARPRLESSRARRRAATARIGVAQAQLYPSLGISGNIGTTSNAFSELFDLITGGVFANVAQTIFDGGQLRSQVRAQRAATDAAFAAYKQSVLTALEDVENAMASLTSARARKVEFATAYDASNNAAILARSQYQAGLIDFQTLSTSENTLLNARNSLASAQADEALAIAQLYNALGGGWQSMDNRPDEQ